MNMGGGFQAEGGGAVVEEVEFDVASAPDQLLLAVFGAPRCAKIAPDQFGIDLQERAADVLREGEVGVPIARIVPVVENAADAAGLLAVRKIKIFVTPFFIFVVVGNAVVAAAGRLHRGMEGNRVGVLLAPPPLQDRRQIGAAAEPRLAGYAEAR